MSSAKPKKDKKKDKKSKDKGEAAAADDAEAKAAEVPAPENESKVDEQEGLGVETGADKEDPFSTTTFPVQMPDFYQFELQKQLENIEMALRRTQDAHLTQRRLADTYGYDADAIGLLQQLVSKMIVLENDRLHIINNISLAQAMKTVPSPPPMTIPGQSYYIPANPVAPPVQMPMAQQNTYSNTLMSTVPTMHAPSGTRVYIPELEASRHQLIQKEAYLMQTRQAAVAASTHAQTMAMEEQRAIEAARFSQANLMRAQAQAAESARIAQELVRRSQAQRTYAANVQASLFQAQNMAQKVRHETALAEYQNNVNLYHQRQQLAAQQAALRNSYGRTSYLGGAGTGKNSSYYPWSR
jgi:hypothetical protein